ncbi:hypothetical protein L9F63_020014 [Diploptera punctata]|uniref:YEATS domain-containing protein n=1 Tax=Diploptera punctata TaxID=6984 RepID=A0AAD7ZTS6_DIPPU|nr:hypothetical protein L9F63_020014 [Diploptera punctata]
MSCPKRPLDGQDPDYEDSIPHETKRLRLLEENAKVEFSQRVCNIIQREFGSELAKREKEILELQERLQQAQKTLHMLRYVAVASFYDKKQVASMVTTEEKQKPIHPAVKKLIGKEPRNWEPLNQRPSKYRPVATNSQPQPDKTPQEPVSKVPRYIPPKSNPQANAVAPSGPRRGMRHKIKKRIVIGNISKWVPVDTREDAASHKWMMYVRGPKEAADVSGFISKVRFFLHPSYRPNDIAEVTSSPFHLSRRGWGEFPVRVQIHFTNPRNKPVDLIHHLKLDRTYTGLQTLGAETVVDIWLHSGEEEPSSENNVGSNEDESIWSITDDNIGAVEEVVNPVKEEDVCRTEMEEGESSANHDYVANPSTKLATLVKCMDKNGHVFYLTLGKVNNKPQVHSVSYYFLKTTVNRSTDRSNKKPPRNDITLYHNREVDSASNTNEFQISFLVNYFLSLIIDTAELFSKLPSVQEKKIYSKNHTRTMNFEIPDEPSLITKTPDGSLENNSFKRTPDGSLDNYRQKKKLTVNQMKVVPEQTSILRRRLTNTATPPKQENGNNQSILIVKNGQLYLLNSGAGRGGIRSVLKKPIKTEEEVKLPVTSRAIVLNKQNSRQITVSNKMRYEKALSKALSACKFPDVALSVRWLLRHMPLVKSTARDPDYRVVHPYAAPDDITFLQWNVGKQRAAEWMRAKAVQSALRTHFPEESVWGVRAIIVWARMHGYCPMPVWGETTTSESRPATCSTYSEPVRIMDWLVTAQKSDAGSESDEEIDVISTQLSVTKMKLKQEPQVTRDVEVLNVDPDVELLCTFVRDSARELGYKLEPQELAPGVMSCVTERLLAESVRLLAEDLLRRSLCQAWIRNSNKPPNCIQVEDTQADVLTILRT